jgi:hypothetical protein
MSDLEYNDTPTASPLISLVISCTQSPESQAKSSDSPLEPTCRRRSNQDLWNPKPKFLMQRWLKKVSFRRRKKPHDETSKEGDFIGGDYLS